jgi:hypothetical protein
VSSAASSCRGRARNIVLLLILSFACKVFYDDSTYLAARLKKAATRLRSSSDTEAVVRYVPLGGVDQTYEVRFLPSEQSPPPYSPRPTLTVTGRTGGHTNSHRRSFSVPKELRVSKTNTFVEIVLRKNGDRIEVVELR